MSQRRDSNRLRALKGAPERLPRHVRALKAPTPPSWLPAEGKREWKQVLEATRDHRDWVTEADRAALASYCMVWATFVEAAKDVARRGPLVAGRSSADAARGDTHQVIQCPSTRP